MMERFYRTFGVAGYKFGVAGLCTRTFCACLCARAALAATVFPATATNYYFTTPLRPGAIRGEVMGTPPAYYTPRSEDFDWLNEAWAEREALAYITVVPGRSTFLKPTFGMWHLSETNRFYRWVTAVDAAGVTNVVVGYNLVTNVPSSRDSPGVKFDSGIRAGSVAESLWNPTGSIDYRWKYLDSTAPLVADARAYDLFADSKYTNIYYVATYGETETNAYSTIEMPMANGMVSVHTNIWTATLRAPVMVPRTNIMDYAYLDYCHAGSGPFPGYASVPPLVGPGAYSMAVALSNDYAAIRGAARLAESEAYAVGRPEYELTAFYTNGVSSGVITNYGGSHYAYELSGSDGIVWERYTLPLAHDITWRTRFSPWAVTTGGVERVTVEAAFAHGHLSYGTEYYGGVTLRIDVPERIVVTPSNTYVTATLNSRTLLERAAAVSGVPAPPAPTDYRPSGRGESWIIEVDTFSLVYSIRPTAKFDDWQER